MSDTPSPVLTAGLARPADRMEALASVITLEVQERAARVSRMEALRDRAASVKTLYAKIMQEVEDIETAFKAEVGG